MKIHLIIFTFAGLTFTGCSHTIGNNNLGDDSEINSQMNLAKTKSDVEKLYGAPSKTFQNQGSEVYEYKKISGTGRYNWLIPIWGWILAPMWQDAYTYNTHNLYVKFDEKDHVKDWKLITDSGTVN